MRRGDIWWARLPAPMGSRPVVLLSRDEAYRVRDLVTVAPITTTVRDLPVEVPLGTAEGLPKPCVVNLDTLMTIRKSQLTRLVSSLPPDKIHEVNNALRFALAIPSSSGR